MDNTKDQILLHIKNSVTQDPNFSTITFLELQTKMEIIINNYNSTRSVDAKKLNNHIACHAINMSNRSTQTIGGIVNNGYYQESLSYISIVNNCWNCGGVGHNRSQSFTIMLWIYQFKL